MADGFSVGKPSLLGAAECEVTGMGLCHDSQLCRTPISNRVKGAVSSEVLGISEQKLIRETGAACEVGWTLCHSVVLKRELCSPLERKWALDLEVAAGLDICLKGS